MFIRNDLKVEETVAWNCLIKWGIEQTSGLGSKNNNRTKWNQENFEALEKTLSQFIPLIRIVEISPNDFFNKICLYKSIIPHHIYKEVIEFYHKGTLPKTISFVPRVASTLIKPNPATILANWIDKNNSIVFNLIYKKSRDSFDIKTFNDECNGKGPFVLLIQVESKKIHGGYNPIGYALRGAEWLSSDDFIFSFKNSQDIHNMKIERVINTTQSVWKCCNRSFFNFGSHLSITEKKVHLGNYGNYNDIFNILSCSPVEEIEVFTLVEI